MISLCMVVRNEFEKIEKCILDIARFVDEIVAVDQSSEDGTWEVLKKYCHKCEQTENKGFCEPDRQLSLTLASGPWALVIDADEFLDADLKNLLKGLPLAGYDGYLFRRKDIIDGKEMNLLGDDWQLRFFRKELTFWPPDMHTYPIVRSNNLAKVERGHILHIRTLEGIKKATATRNMHASAQVVQAQNNFLRRVEEALAAGNNQPVFEGAGEP